MSHKLHNQFLQIRQPLRAVCYAASFPMIRLIIHPIYLYNIAILMGLFGYFAGRYCYIAGSLRPVRDPSEAGKRTPSIYNIPQSPLPKNNQIPTQLPKIS